MTYPDFTNRYLELVPLLLGRQFSPGEDLDALHRAILERVDFILNPKAETMEVTIITTWYDEKDPVRLAEMTEALTRNHALGGDVIVLAEKVPPPQLPGLDVRLMPRRPTMLDAIKACKPGTLVALINTDCYFEKAIPVTPRLREGKAAWCLTRYEAGVDGKPPVRVQGKMSQDAWVFRVPESSLMKPLPSCNFPFGILACDNAMAAALHIHGFRLANPCDDVRIIHIHHSPVRHYDKKQVPEPWLFVPPSKFDPS